MRCLTTGLAATVAVFLGAARASVANDNGKTPDEKALQSLNQAFVAAFNRGDVKAMAAAYAPDADFLSAEGQRVKGRAELEKYFAKGFAENKGLKLRHSESSIRFLTPDVAIDAGIWEITGRRGGRAAKGCYSAILTNRDGQWLIAYDRLMVPVPPPEP